MTVGMIEVNTVNPDAVIQDSGIWSSDWKAERASTYGVTEDDLQGFYRKRTKLGVDVFPDDVAEAIAFFASELAVACGVGRPAGDFFPVPPRILACLRQGVDRKALRRRARSRRRNRVAGRSQ